MSKSFVFTINNYNESDIQAVRGIPCQRIVAGFEVAESGTPHIQGAIVFKRTMRCPAVGKALGGRANVHVMNGSWADQEYCVKDGAVLR